MIKPKTTRMLITIPTDLFNDMEYYSDEMETTKSKMVEELLGSAMPTLLRLVEIKQQAEKMSEDELKNLENQLSDLSKTGDLADEEIKKKLGGF